MNENYVKLQERRLVTKRESSMGEGARYITLASEVFILTLVGLYLGQFLGQKIGTPFDILGIVVGALGGFLVGVYSVYKTVERLEKKTVIHIGKKLCPECLRAIPSVLEKCPYCGYSRSRKTE
jgi:F0F1-type ATP synthase assembly protein I